MKNKESQTQQNLMTAYLRESGAFNEYTFYAEQAKNDGYQEIYNTFTQFAHNEQAHAKIWFQLFHGIAGTEENLLDAKDLENYESSVMYAEFSKTAREEGFPDIADLFDKVAEVERQHEQTYKTLHDSVKEKSVFVKKDEETWQCLNCGQIYKGKTAPEKCPLCSFPKAYFHVIEKQ